MSAARAYLQISLGKTRSTPTCMHELMTTHVAVKDHVTPDGVWLNFRAKLLINCARNDSEKMIANLR